MKVLIFLVLLAFERTVAFEYSLFLHGGVKRKSTINCVNSKFVDVDGIQRDQICKTCKNCHLQYVPRDNMNSKTCKFHPGIYSGRLNRINDIDTSDLEYFWSCCGEYNLSAIGCVSSYHYSVFHFFFFSCIYLTKSDSL